MWYDPDYNVSQKGNYTTLRMKQKVMCYMSFQQRSTKAAKVPIDLENTVTKAAVKYEPVHYPQG